jgi:hypothetical protein
VQEGLDSSTSQILATALLQSCTICTEFCGSQALPTLYFPL